MAEGGLPARAGRSPWSGAPTRRHLREGLIVAGLLAGLLSLFFAEAVFGGRALVAADLIHVADPLWRPYAPPGFRGAGNPLLGDTIEQGFAWRAYIQQWLARGELPLWNASVLAGVSFLGNDQSALFYPINAIAYLLPLTTSFTFTAIARLLAAGVSTYAYLRVTGRRVVAALAGAVAFSLCGFLVVWLGWPQVNAAVWLPALLVLLEVLFRSGRLVWTVPLALVMGVQFLGGHIQTSFHILVIAALYALVLAGRAWARGAPDLAWGGLIRAGLGALIGIGLGAAQLAPFLEQLRQAPILAERAGGWYGPWTLIYPEFWRDAIALPTILFPTLFGSPAQAESGYFAIQQVTRTSNYNEAAAYVGTIPLLLAALGAGAARRDGRLAFWMIAGLVSLAVAVRFPLFEAINHLPIFQVSSNGRLRLIFSFAAVTVGAAGLDRLIDLVGGSTPRDGPRARRLALIVAGFGLAIPFATLTLALALIAYRDDVITFGLRQGDLQIDLHYRLALDRLSLANWRLYLPAAAALLLAGTIWLAVRRRIRPGLVGPILVAATAVELFGYGIGYNPAVDPARIFPETPALSFLRANAGSERIAGVEDILGPNSAMIWDLKDIRGYEPVQRSRTATLLRLLDPRTAWLDRLLLVRIDPALLDLFSVRYLLAGDDTAARIDPARFPRVFTESIPRGGEAQAAVGATVFENPSAVPRAHVVGRATVLGSALEIRNVFSLPRRAAFDPRREVLLEAVQQPPVQGLVEGPAEARIWEDRPNLVRVAARTEGAGYLVLHDSDDPGWRATMDGRPAPVYRANFAFRAVRLEPGDHQIEFRYDPVGFRIGLVLTGAALGIIVLVLALERALDRSIDALAGLAARRPLATTGGLLAAVIAVVGALMALNWTPPGPPAEGSLLLDPATGRVYRIEAGRKRPILNVETLFCLQQPERPPVATGGLAAIPDGPAIENRTGCRLPPPAQGLIQALGHPDVYLSTGERLRLIPNARTLACLERGGAVPIEGVAAVYIDALTKGPGLADGEGC